MVAAKAPYVGGVALEVSRCSFLHIKPETTDYLCPFCRVGGDPRCQCIGCTADRSQAGRQEMPPQIRLGHSASGVLLQLLDDVLIGGGGSIQTPIVVRLEARETLLRDGRDVGH